MAEWTLQAAAVACTSAGIVLLYRSWSRRPRGSRFSVAAGWLLLAAAATSWIRAAGWEFGAIHAFTVPSLVAVLLLGLVADRRPGRPELAARAALGGPSWRAIRGQAVTLLLVAVLGATSSILLTSAVGLRLPFGELDQMVFIVCTMPVVWGLVACWLTMAARRARPVISLVALSALSLLSILVR